MLITDSVPGGFKLLLFACLKAFTETEILAQAQIYQEKCGQSI